MNRFEVPALVSSRPKATSSYAVDLSNNKALDTLICLQDSWRPLKKRRLRTNATYKSCSPEAAASSTVLSYGFGGVPRAQLRDKTLAENDLKTCSSSEYLAVPCKGASSKTEIDLDALTYYPPHPNSRNQVTTVEAGSARLRRHLLKPIRRNKRVRFTLPV